MSRKTLFFAFGLMGFIVLAGVLFLQYQAYEGRKTIASLGEEYEEGTDSTVEQRDEFYIMTDEEIAKANEEATEEESKGGVLATPESSVVVIKDFGFGGIAQDKKGIFERVAEAQEQREKPEPKQLKSLTVVYESGSMIIDEEEYEKFLNEQGEEEPVRKITMLKAPVGYKIIKTQAEFNTFKKTAWGTYPKVDFAQKDFFILESKGDLGDNIFQIADFKVNVKTLNVEYRVNILGLKERATSHTYAVIGKGVNKVELKQIL